MSETGAEVFTNPLTQNSVANTNKMPNDNEPADLRKNDM
jgi:hypothetical protein